MRCYSRRDTSIKCVRLESSGLLLNRHYKGFVKWLYIKGIDLLVAWSKVPTALGSVGIYGTCRISITGFDNIIIAREARVGAQAGFATVLVARVGAQAGFAGTALAAGLGLGFVLAFRVEKQNIGSPRNRNPVGAVYSN